MDQAAQRSAIKASLNPLPNQINDQIQRANRKDVNVKLANSVSDLEMNRMHLGRKPFNRKESQFARRSRQSADDESSQGSSQQEEEKSLKNAGAGKRSHRERFVAKRNKISSKSNNHAVAVADRGAMNFCDLQPH